MDNFRPSSNFLTLAMFVAAKSLAKRANLVNLAMYLSTVIVPYFSSRNSRAFASRVDAENYLPMKRSHNSSHVIASKFLEALT